MKSNFSIRLEQIKSKIRRFNDENYKGSKYVNFHIHAETGKYVPRIFQDAQQQLNSTEDFPEDTIEDAEELLESLNRDEERLSCISSKLKDAELEKRKTFIDSIILKIKSLIEEEKNGNVSIELDNVDKNICNIIKNCYKDFYNKHINKIDKDKGNKLLVYGDLYKELSQIVLDKIYYILPKYDSYWRHHMHLVECNIVEHPNGYSGYIFYILPNIQTKYKSKKYTIRKIKNFINENLDIGEIIFGTLYCLITGILSSVIANFIYEIYLGY